MAIHFDTQGPAPDGFHVPLNTEWQAVRDIRVALGGGSSDGTNFGIALKLPFAGMRSRIDASVKYQGTNGFYWSSTRYNESSARRLRFSSSNIYPQDNIYRSNASSVRCFKDTPVEPTNEVVAGPISSGGISPSTQGPTLSLWTATKSCDCTISGSLYGSSGGGVTYADLYKNNTYVSGASSGFISGSVDFEMQVSVVPGDVLTLQTSRGSSGSGAVNNVYVTISNGWTTLYDGSSIANGAGIFHNSTLEIISLSGDGTTWITIADKNLGATTVWNSGDTLSQANCGNYYQWGNNYGFPRTGSVTTSSTQVDASTYGPGNYYSSSTFITRSSSPYRWDSTDNGNLWGGVTKGWWYDLAKLHGAIQTFHFQPTLLDISDLKEFPEEEGLFFNTPNVYGIAEELNKYPQVYYAKFLGENNLYSAYGKTNVLGNGEGDPYIVTETFKGEPYKYIAFYNTETMKREVYSEYGGLSIDV